jgi:hypothetical protein
MTSTPVQRRPAGPLVVAGLSAVTHLVVGSYYLAGGLVWLALRRSWWTAAVPVVAAVVLVLTVVVGEQSFGWTA